MRHRSALRHFSLYQLLSYTSEFRATDPRDRIYGKLGLHAFSRSGMRIEPDYDKTVKEVYRDFAVLGMNHYANLEILSFAGLKDRMRHDVPSWVPQWDKNLVSTSISVQGSEPFSTWTWNATDNIPLETPAKFRNDSLFVKGVTLDQIHRLIKLDSAEWRRTELSSEHNPLYQMWRQLKVTDGHEVNDPSNLGNPRFWMCAASIVAGVDFANRRVTKIWDKFQANILSLIDVIASERDNQDAEDSGQSSTTWFEYRHQAHKFATGRVLFETSSGYIGLGPESLQRGESVCVLYGGKVPYILHRGNGFHTLVGESYVHGFMDREAIGMLRAGQLEEQEFEIR
jgi:hypothetical protein